MIYCAYFACAFLIFVCASSIYLSHKHRIPHRLIELAVDFSGIAIGIIGIIGIFNR